MSLNSRTPYIDAPAWFKAYATGWFAQLEMLQKHITALGEHNAKLEFSQSKVRQNITKLEEHGFVKYADDGPGNKPAMPSSTIKLDDLPWYSRFSYLGYLQFKNDFQKVYPNSNKKEA